MWNIGIHSWIFEVTEISTKPMKEMLQKDVLQFQKAIFFCTFWTQNDSLCNWAAAVLYQKSWRIYIWIDVHMLRGEDRGWGEHRAIWAL